MADSNNENKRWTVTYTKHVKQKRKVYQDGALELQISSCVNKVFLYDDGGNVLDSRFLKKDEKVECDGTLAFGGYLVDIGDFEKNSKPLVDSNVERKDTKPVVGKFVMFQRKKGLHDSSSIGSKKSGNMAGNGASENNPILIHNIKREHKNSEYSKGSAPGGRLNSIMANERGSKQIWQQNAPKQNTGSSPNLKEHRKSECFKGSTPGGHLNPMMANERGSKQIRQQNAPQQNTGLSPNMTEEWHVLYTTQITQKSKKYHDGILRLAFVVYERKQVTLLNEDGALLSSKYLNSSEDVKTGSTLQLTNYLVEIGEERILLGGEVQNDASSSKGISKVDRINFNGRGTRTNTTHDGRRNDTSSGEGLALHSSDCTDVKNVKGANDIGNKPIRDAHQILFTLKRPTVQESLASSREPPREKVCSSESSDFQFNMEEKLPGQNTLEPKLSERNVKDNLENNPESLNVGKNGSKIPQSKEVLSVPSSGITSSVVPNSGSETEPLTPSNVSLGMGASSSLTSETGLKYPEKATKNPVSSILPQVSNNTTSVLLEVTQAAGTSGKNDALDSAVKIKEGHSFTDGEGHSANGCRMRNDVKDENSNQVVKTKAMEEADMDEFPSFDLGFSQ